MKRNLLQLFSNLFHLYKKGEMNWLEEDANKFIHKVFYNDFRNHKGLCWTFNDFRHYLHPSSVLYEILACIEHQDYKYMADRYANEFCSLWIEVLFDSYIDLYKEIKGRNEYDEPCDPEIAIYATQQMGNFYKTGGYISLCEIIGEIKVKSFILCLLDNWLQVLYTDRKRV